ncbi:beta-lactamase family protein [Clostridium swellfunianum]|uniref:serine hydrolase domain-containing protein n=1 Tax=Clostridium swellfunianum TaxID=1367462 RepID=UPI00202F3646|nr:beta-lactamase family protein [Clostridium swellfunianum]
MNTYFKINQYLDEYTSLWPFSGAVLVINNEQVVFNKTYGMASIEHSVPITTKTKFKIASLTKQITCMGIMILQERGLLKVNDSIRKFFPDYPELNERITIHNLMTHTSGLFNDFSVVDPYLMLGKRLFTHQEVFDLYKDLPQEFEPGEGWSYCYFGYYLLGVIIERVSGKTYAEFLKENIFEPLGMNNTGLDDYIEILPNKANGYYASGERLVCCEIDTMSAFSAGAIYSTVEDMILWDQALYNNKLVSQNTLNEIFTPFRNNYGYGWFIDEVTNRRRVRHSGGGNGFSHQYHRYIDERVSILVLSNYGFSNSFDINENIAKIIFNEKYSSPSKPRKSELDMKVYDTYTGVYQEEGFKLEVKRDNELLYFVQENKWVMPIYPISADKFHHTWIDREYVFEKDDKGQLCFDGLKKVY